MIIDAEKLFHDASTAILDGARAVYPGASVADWSPDSGVWRLEWVEARIAETANDDDHGAGAFADLVVILRAFAEALAVRHQRLYPEKPFALDVKLLEQLQAILPLVGPTRLCLTAPTGPSLN
ncbi:MAG: hypothetical protein GY719_26000 [bacterium]|nr:hypothetical protein [bacterium]